MDSRGAWLALIGVGMFAGLATGPVRSVLESSMAGQMLIQMPLLALTGALCAQAVPPCWKVSVDRWNRGGLPGMLLASFVATYWMLPRALDAALASAFAEAAKFVSLPLLLGLPVALSWHMLHPIAKGFVVANWISMLAVLGWLYRAAPLRLCNYYLLDQQIVAGDALIAIAIAATGAWFALAVIGSGRSRKGYNRGGPTHFGAQPAAPRSRSPG
jgi:hypothetical protein